LNISEYVILSPRFVPLRENRQVVRDGHGHRGICLVGVEPEPMADPDVAGESLAGIFAGDGDDAGRIVLAEIKRLRALEDLHAVDVEQAEGRYSALRDVDAVDVVSDLSNIVRPFTATVRWGIFLWERVPMPRRRASALAGTVALFAAGAAWALPPTGKGDLQVSSAVCG
jgi:hypothetical protein